VRSVDWLWFVPVLVLGLIALVFLGLTMAGIMLLSGQQSWGLGELMAGALYLFSGAIFPIDVMPAALRPIGLALPATYWLELLRRSLVDSTDSVSTIFRDWSNPALVLTLLALTCLYAVASLGAFRWCERRARTRGLIDRTTNY
jgi:ABC-2 type transport system permease protein